MKIDYVPIICIIFLTLFLLVVVPITKTPKGDIGDIGDIMIIDSATTVNVSVKVDTPTIKVITTIQH